MEIFPWGQTRIKPTRIHLISKVIALEYSVPIRRFLHFTRLSQSRLPFCVRSRPHVFFANTMKMTAQYTQSFTLSQ